MSSSQYLRKTLLCLSIFCNAISAGGVFTYPILAPALISRLTQPQLSTIALAGMAGQYPSGYIVGKVIDRYGSGVCSLAAAVAFSLGYGLSAWEIASIPQDISHSNDASARRLVVYFALLGLGTAFSYFSFLFAATKTFTNHMSFASGSTMAVFGLSPLFLSTIASRFFTDLDGTLNIVPYLWCIALLSGVVHFVGAITLSNAGTSASHHNHSTSPDSEECSPDETTSLLSNSPEARRNDDDGSVFVLLQDAFFWILCIYLVMTLGMCEMIFSNVGTMVLSLPSSTLRSTITVENTASIQVKMLSIANTLSRLLVGPFADFLSPANEYPTQSFRKHWISRIAFLSFAAIMLSATCLWMLVYVQIQQDLWVLRFGVWLHIYSLAQYTLLHLGNV
ncbi:hypothetical protein D9758_003255 [Tetrapyrgos nigripes]|uniref:MFS general substrate transporter n=1 Tax=Tetrapyrgos nigripes TaxID=182062 RepID=A0A8H5GIH6_9AGAR|nr:hypothetical protein D9758_003255 [Tetrapyrgos nigripes]